MVRDIYIDREGGRGGAKSCCAKYPTYIKHITFGHIIRRLLCPAGQSNSGITSGCDVTLPVSAEDVHWIEDEEEG